MQTARQQYSAKNLFTYQPPVITALAPGNSTTQSFSIDGDSDFYWSRLCAYAQDGDAGTTASTVLVPGCAILITNTTSGRQYMNAAVPLYSLAGSGQLPFLLPIETFFPAKATITITVQNITDDITYSDLYLSFIGVKAFF